MRNTSNRRTFLKHGAMAVSGIVLTGCGVLDAASDAIRAGMNTAATAAVFYWGSPDQRSGAAVAAATGAETGASTGLSPRLRAGALCTMV